MKSVFQIIKSGLPILLLNKTLGIKTAYPSAPKLGKKITFPWERLPTHICFGCSPQNAKGLKMKFYQTAEADIACRVMIPEYLQGYPGVVHGGISATILDEISGHVLLYAHQRVPMTVNLNCHWIKPLAPKETCIATGKLSFRLGDFCYVKSYLFKENNQIAVTADGLFYLPSLTTFEKISGINIPNDLRAWF